MSKIERETPEEGYNVGVVKYPRLPAYLSADGTQLRVWCPFCDEWHHHGAGNKGGDEYPLYGGRAPHCRCASPWARKGYHLVDPQTLEKKRG